MDLAKKINQIGEWITAWVLDHPWYAIALSFLLVALTIPGLPKNSLSSDHRDFFGPDNPRILAFNELEETYTKVDNIVFVIHTPGKKALDSETYQIIQFVTEEAWQLPAASRVDSLSNYQHTSAVDDDLQIEDFLDTAESYTPEELVYREGVALGEPLLVGNLVSEDGFTSAVNVVAAFNDEETIQDMVAAARELVRKANDMYPKTRIALTGSSMMSATFSEAGRADALTLLPGMYLALFLALLMIFRSVVSMLVTLVVVLCSSIIPIGLMGYSGLELTSITIVTPIVVTTLAVADCVHILLTMLHQMRSGSEKIEALKDSLSVNFLAVTITSITTSIGFLCLNFSDSPPFKHLGTLCAIGVVCAWFYSVVLLPAMLRLIPMRVSQRSIQSGSIFQSSMTWLAKLTTSSYKVVITTMLVVCVLVVSQLPKLELNDNFIEFFDDRLSFRVDTDFATEKIGGIYYLHFDVESGVPGGVSLPAYLSRLDSFADWMRKQEHVNSVYSYSDIVKRLNKNMNGDDPSFYRIPDSKDLAAQYSLLYEMSLPYGLDMNDRINVEKSASRLTVILENPTAREIREFSAKAQAWIASNAGSAFETEPVGSSVLFSNISKTNIESMMIGNLLAVTLISLVMIFALNHFGLGLLSTVPNLLPVVMALSLWAIFVGMAGMATAIVAAASLGIVVDNTTHFLTKYVRARQNLGWSKKQAIEYSFDTVGLAITANAVILMSGFLVLSYSSFLPNNQMGLLTAITIGLSLIIGLVGLPSLLMVGSSDKKKQA